MNVDSSERELEALHASIVKAAGEAFQIGHVQVAAVETDIVNNRVNLVAVRANSEDLAVLEGRFGPDVNATSVDARTSGSACPNSNCPNALKGGLKLYRNGSYACMSGFVFRWNTNFYLSTAGHCSTVGDTYQHPSGTNRGSVTHQGWEDNSPTDTSLFAISSSQKSNVICTLAGGNCSSKSITSRENPGAGQEIIGQTTCATLMTVVSCGSLVSVNNTISICKGQTTNCRIITSFRRTTVVTQFGDSGAAVYTGNEALGTISASYPGSSNSIYSHVINTEGYFLVSVQLTP